MDVAWSLSESRASDPQWYVVRSKTRKEDLAIQQPALRSVRVFMPQVVECGQDEVAPQAGDRVQIAGGPLAGLMAVIEQPCPQRGQAKIFLDFLRRGATVELPVGLVDPI